MEKINFEKKEFLEGEKGFKAQANFKKQKSFSGRDKEKIKEDFLDVLKSIAPGTAIRAGLDDLLSARMGALIVVENNFLFEIVEKGFKINCKFSPQKLVELCKMDGAIIISKDFKKILYANALLTPSKKIRTKETGTRHKAGERTAKQSETVVIALSERKNKMSLYYGDISYRLEQSSEILRKTSETLKKKKKQREIFNELLENLNLLEIKGLTSINDICSILQRLEILKRIASIVRRSLVELGKVGMIVGMRLKELTSGLEKEEEFILRDYFGKDFLFSRDVLEKMDFDFLLEPLNISRMLFEEIHDKSIVPKGFRILNKTNLLEKDVSSLIDNFENLKQILSVQDSELLKILKNEGLVTFFKEEIYNIKEKIIIGKKI